MKKTSYSYEIMFFSKVLTMGHVLAILGFLKNFKEDPDHLFKTEQATIKKRVFQ